jgi:hypothetical protein
VVPTLKAEGAARKNSRMHSPVGKLHWERIEIHTENPNKTDWNSNENLRELEWKMAEGNDTVQNKQIVGKYV